jgi:hypothetical protein
MAPVLSTQRERELEETVALLELELEHLRKALVHLTGAARAQADAMLVCHQRQAAHAAADVFGHAPVTSSPVPAATLHGRAPHVRTRKVDDDSQEDTGPCPVRTRDVIGHL